MLISYENIICFLDIFAAIHHGNERFRKVYQTLEECCYLSGFFMKTTKLLRRMLEKEGIIVAPGAYDGFVAQIIERTGFEAAYVTGAGTSVSMIGKPDIGLITMNEMVLNAKNIANAVKIPVISDADTGYGNAINVMRTVKEFIRAGVAAIHIEDQNFPKRCGQLRRKKIIPLEEAVGKIEAANYVRKEEDEDFVLIARTDAWTAEGGGIDEAIKRGNAYAKACADVVYISPGPGTSEDLKYLVKNISAPLMIPMIEGAKSLFLSVQELEAIGFKIVIYPNSALRAVQKTVTDLMVELKDKGTTRAYWDKMVLFPGYNEVVGMKRIEEFEKRFVRSNIQR